MITNSKTIISIPPCDKQNAGRVTISEGNVLFYGKPAYLRQFCDGSCELCRWDYEHKKWFYLLFPPPVKDDSDKKVFTERPVMLKGKQYYMQQFYDESCLLSRYDKSFGKTIELDFPSKDMPA